MKTSICIALCVLLPAAVIPLEAQQAAPPDSLLAFTTIRMKDHSLFVGRITDENEAEIAFYDNVLGYLTLPRREVRSVTPEVDGARYEVVLINGNSFIGTIGSRSAHAFSLDTKSMGSLTIPVEYLAGIQVIEGHPVQDTRHDWFPNPNATRYLFAPSAIPLKKGEGYYQNAWVVANSANYGVTPHLSLGGGVLLPFAAYATPKISTEVLPGWYIGAGVLVALLPESTLAGIGYGLTTVGNPENNITLGMGYGFTNDEATEKPVFTLNGMARISEKVALVSENWLVNVTLVNDDETFDEDPQKAYRPFVSYGVRFMWDRFTIDAAFVNGYLIYETFIIGVPYIDFIMRF